MVLVVTVNPLLERRLSFNQIELGEVNRSNFESFQAGGKGINVSRQLNHLGIQNTSFTFTGGYNGKIFRNVLAEEKINAVYVNTKNPIRSASIILEKKENRVTSYFGPNTILLEEEIEEFKSKLPKMIQNCSVVILSGSSPSIQANSIFSFSIELAKKYDKFFILDTYGNHLEDCLNYSPICIHNNIQEIENSLNINLKTKKDKIDFLKYLYNKGIKLVFLTDGNKPTYAANFNFHYKIDNPIIAEIDATGSGDAFVAGVAYGVQKNLIFEETVKIAAALGTANASEMSVCDISADKMYLYLKEVKINTLGKKIKIIDDSPTNNS